jgi:histidinol-phosphate phosphatase family protein
MIETKANQFSDRRYKITKRDGILSFCLSSTGPRTPRPTVFLDRDGVLNRRIAGGYIRRWAEFVFLPDVVESLGKLVAGFQFVIVSNQAGVAKGILSYVDLIDITQASLDELQARGLVVQGAFFCLHAPSDACSCRKPKVGLLEEAARVLPVDFRRSFFIGDSPSDMEAGERMGCTTIFLDSSADAAVSAAYRAGSIRDAVGAILRLKS